MADRVDQAHSLEQRFGDVAHRLQRVAAATGFTESLPSSQLEALLTTVESVTQAIESTLAVAGTEPGDRSVKRDAVDRLELASQGAQRITHLLYAAMLVLGVVAAAVVSIGLVDAASSDGESGVLWGFFVAGGVLLAGVVPVWVQAERHRREAAEALRTRQHILLADGYLAPFPQPEQSIMRAALGPRLFPQAAATSDPLLEPAWPSFEALLGGDPQDATFS